MSRLRRVPAVIWQLLLVTLLGSPLLTQLVRWTAVACTHDGHLHFHRVAALRHGWESGVYFSRWLPDLAFGYGYPFFVYREPLPLYAVLMPHLLGLPLPAAENLFYAVCILAAGWFTFLWVRDIFGARAGIVAAVAYMSAPYVLIDALVRGNSPESLALPLMPLLLWAARRWLLSGRRRWFVVTVVSLAFFSLSHNISLLLFTPVLFVYLALLAWLHRLSLRTAAGRILTVFVLGLGMTLFYSAGALLEINEVTLQQSTNTRNNDFHFNFVTLAEILAPVAAENPSVVNPPLLFRLGWVTLGLALLGLFSLAMYRRPDAVETAEQGDVRRERIAHIVMMTLATGLFLFMAFPLSVGIWESVPLIDFVQFPWRFVGRAALPLALLAGAPFACMSTTALPGQGTRWLTAQRVLFFVAVPLLLLEALPNLYPNECREVPFPTILTVHTYEHETGLVGVDPEGSYFPRTVGQRPDGSPLEVDYAAAVPPQRFDVTALPDGAELLTASYEPLQTTVRIDSPDAFTARFLTFAFPGWLATVDGEPVPITAGQPDGLITVPVPAGSHEIVVRWANTPLRTTLIVLSLLALGGLVAVLVWGRRVTGADRVDYAPGADCLVKRDYQILALMAIVMLGLRLLVVDQLETPLRRSTAVTVAEPATLQAGELALLGYNLSREPVPSGEPVDIDLAWSVSDYPQARYQSNVWLADADGLLWSDKETFRPRLYEDAPISLAWQPGQQVWDSRELQLLSGTPPGQYNIVLTLFDRETLRPFTLTDAEGQPLGPTAVIGQIEVVPPGEPAQLVPRVALDPVSFGGWQLLGVSQDRDSAAPGDPFLLTLYWEREADEGQATVDLTLLDAAGKTLQTWSLPAGSEANVAAGEQIRSQHLLRLPAQLEDGRYQFQLDERVELGMVTVDAPERTFREPAVATAVGQSLTLDGVPLATLVGLEGTEANDDITLIWRSDGIFPASYRVFVHLVDDSGQILAQADGEPANWSRPTTGWTPGEYVRDSRRLVLPTDLPAGPLALHIGLYDPADGRRLQTEAGDFIVVPLP